MLFLLPLEYFGKLFFGGRFVLYEISLRLKSGEHFVLRIIAFKTIAVSIDANKKFIIYYDGKKYFESSALASVQDQYYVSRSGFGLDNKVVIFADNLFVFDNGTICTAEPRER